MIYIISEIISGKVIGAGLFGNNKSDNIVIFFEFDYKKNNLHPNKLNKEDFETYIYNLSESMIEHKKTKKTLENHFDTKLKCTTIKDNYGNDVYYNVIYINGEEYNQILDIINNHLNEVIFRIKRKYKEPLELCIEKKSNIILPKIDEKYKNKKIINLDNDDL